MKFHFYLYNLLTASAMLYSACLLFAGCATDSSSSSVKELTPEQHTKLAELAPKVQQGDSRACYTAAGVYRTSHQYGKADQVLRFGAHFGTPQADDYASLHCVEGLLLLYGSQMLDWDSGYGTIMNDLNLAYTYLNYLVAHHYTGEDPDLAKSFEATGSKYPTEWLFNLESQLSSLQYKATLAAQIHNTQAEGLSKITSAFNQSLNTVAASIH